jgi:nucleotide-binding universal stress UspA family protein
MSFQKILCPVDFSEGSSVALRYAVRLANESDAELVIAHSWYVPPMMFAGEPTFSPDLFQVMSDDAKKGLEASLKQAKDLGARRVTSKLLTGAPWYELVELLETDKSYDLVVMGTHGRTGVSRVLLGSVAEKIVRHAPCSVLCVRPDAPGKQFTHVLCPIDFSESSQFAVDMAVEMARPWGAGITLLHVIEVPVAYSGEPLPVSFMRDLDKHSAELLERWAANLRAKVSVPVATRSRIGRPGKEVVETLDADKTYDLVSVGSHGRTGIRRALLGSVAEKVVRHARCPVMVARRRV